jgi:hypothetical protein
MEKNIKLKKLKTGNKKNNKKKLVKFFDLIKKDGKIIFVFDKR